ncbi:MAG TPA: cytochrome c peroxidase [Chitinophagaceae bacterium]|nr:cytochrome c peroxidase [Chitinophagaceae bacterium]
MFPKKINRLTLIAAALVILSVFSLLASFRTPGESVNEAVDNYYSKNLTLFRNRILSFRTLVNQKAILPRLKAAFIDSRMTYKQLAVLTEYYNPFETKNLNGPAIDRIESEIADRIIAPQGLQAAEQLLFGEEWTADQYNKLEKLLTDMLPVIDKLEREPDRIYKFKDALVWDAIRSGLVQLVSAGITGFDSPVANLSMKEGQSTIKGMRALLAILKSSVSKEWLGDIATIDKLLVSASGYLAANPDFNRFDRLQFISRYINPVYAAVVKTRIKAGISAPEGRSAINYEAPSLFDENALQVDFYSPPKEYWVTPERIELGKQLFSDPVLSGPHTRSCASCHKPEMGFTDGLAKPYALDNKTLLTRNTPTLWNSGYQTRQFMDSRSDILENQLTEVVHNLQEMDGSLKRSVQELKKNAEYAAKFKKAYPAEKETVSIFTIANAISSYVRSLRSLNSRFDQYMRGDRTQLTIAEKNGFNLFAGKGKCATCHFIPLFNGVVPPFFAETESEVVGVPKTKDKKGAVLDEDEGKYSFTRSMIHKYSFKTPTLRNIALTGPYMHNGVYDSLEEVMEFYNNGGGKGLNIAPPNQTLPFDKLSLSKKEIADIIAFMRALTDTSRSL